MLKFADPIYLYLLLTIPSLIALRLFSNIRCHKRIKAFGDEEIVMTLVDRYSKRRPLLKFVLLLMAIAAIAVMLARPQSGVIESKDSTKGIEVVFMMDVSNSMLAQDVQPNRLERSKLLVSTLIDRMKNDKIALGVFAGEAYPQLPITNDYVSAKMFLDNISTGMVTLQGTSVASAIKLADKSFTDKKDIGKAIIIITDGEDHEQGAVDAAKKVAKEGKRVFVLGVGSQEGATIPMPGGSDLKDASGQTVVTKLNVDMCKEVAEAGHGMYLHVDNTNNAGEELKKQLDTLEQADTVGNYTEYDEQFRAFALIALFLIVLEMFIKDVKSPLVKRLNLLGK